MIVAFYLDVWISAKVWDADKANHNERTKPNDPQESDRVFSDEGDAHIRCDVRDKRITVELTRRRESKHPPLHQASYETRSRRSRPTICWVAWFEGRVMGRVAQI